MESERNVVKSPVETRWQLPEEKPSQCDMPQEKKLIRVAAYCRVSSELDRQMDSLEIQKRHFMTFVHNAPDLELVGIYIDQGITGTDCTKRLGFQRMLRHCDEEKIDRILCKSISRFGRNTTDVLKTINHLKDKNIGVFFDKENIDTLSQTSEFVLAALAAIAQDEIRSLSENLKWSQKKRFQQGTPIFRRILGYDVKQTGGEIIISINEEEAVIVREIFALALQDMGQKTIAAQMTKKNYTTARGKSEWAGHMIKAVLSNERYTGDALCQKVYSTDYLSHQLKVNKGERQQYLVENHHPAIISHDIFNEVQGLFGDHKKVGTKRKKYSFSGRLICGDCGAKYQISRHCKDIGWQCSRSLSRDLCNSTSIYELRLKEVLKKAFEGRYGTSNKSMIHRLKLDISRIHANDSFEKQRINFNNKLSTALELEKYNSGNEQEQARERRQELEEKITQIERYWSFIEEDRKYRTQALEWLDKLPRTERNSETLLQSLNIECMRALVMEVRVFIDGTYVIRWADDTETKVIENSDVLFNKKMPYRQRMPKVRKIKSLEDSVMRTDFLSQVIKVKPQKTTNDKPIVLSIPAIHDDSCDSSEFKRTRVCAYCRVSTNQTDQLSSYELQVSHYTNYILSNESWKFSGIYADEGASGTSVHRRPNFMRMIDDCKAGSKIDLIITKSISRFARNTVDCLTYVRLLKSLPSPVGVYFERENINTLDDEKSEVLITLLSGLAQDESRVLSENVIWGIRKRFENGIVTISIKYLLGYDVDHFGNWTINDEQAKTVQRIYREFLAGKPMRQIAKDLTNEGIKTSRGGTWYYSSLHRILENEKYCGDVLLQKQCTANFMDRKKTINKGQQTQYFIEDHHEAIILKDDWNAVQAKLNKGRRLKNCNEAQKEKQQRNKTVFSKMIFCSNCGNYFVRQIVTSSGQQKRPYPIWLCKVHHGTLPHVECRMGSCREEELENAFMAMLLEIYQEQDTMIKDVNNAAQKRALSVYEVERIDLLQREIKFLRQKFNQEGLLIRQGESPESMSELILRFSRENEPLQDELEKLNEKCQEELLIKKDIDWLLATLTDLEVVDPLIEYFQFREDIFSRLVKRCVVYDNGSLIFELNIGISRKIIIKDIEKRVRKNEEIKRRLR